MNSWRLPEMEGLDILRQGLLLAILQYLLSFRCTILEFVLPGENGTAWWEGLAGLWAGFGLQIRFLDQAGIEALTRWVLSPNLEYNKSCHHKSMYILHVLQLRKEKQANI